MKESWLQEIWFVLACLIHHEEASMRYGDLAELGGDNSMPVIQTVSSDLSMLTFTELMRLGNLWISLIWFRLVARYYSSFMWNKDVNRKESNFSPNVIEIFTQFVNMCKQQIAFSKCPGNCHWEQWYMHEFTHDIII